MNPADGVGQPETPSPSACLVVGAATPGRASTFYYASEEEKARATNTYRARGGSEGYDSMSDLVMAGSKNKRQQRTTASPSPSPSDDLDERQRSSTDRGVARGSGAPAVRFHYRRNRPLPSRRGIRPPGGAHYGRRCPGGCDALLTWPEDYR